MPKRSYPRRMRGILTHHAKSRAQEHGIPEQIIDVVPVYGRRLPKEDVFKVIIDVDDCPASIEPPLWSAAREVTVIENERGIVVTVYPDGHR